MKPALSLAGTPSLPSRSANVLPTSKASSEVVTQRTTSTSSITCAGLKKWRPRKRSGRLVEAAWSITGSEDVFVANTAPSLTAPSSSAGSLYATGPSRGPPRGPPHRPEPAREAKRAEPGADRGPRGGDRAGGDGRRREGRGAGRRRPDVLVGH